MSSGTIDDYKVRQRTKSNRKVVEQNSFLCTICLIHFKSEYALQIHKTVWTSKYICNCCNARFCTTKGLKSHLERSCCVKLHFAIYSCNHCNVQSRSKTSLQSHLFHVHGDIHSMNIVCKGQLEPSDNSISEQLSILSERPKSLVTSNSELSKLLTAPCTPTKRLIKSSSFSKSSPKTFLKSLDSPPKTSLKILSVPSEMSPKLNALHGSPPKMCNNTVTPKKMKQSSMDNFVIVSKVEKTVVPSVAQSSVGDIEKNSTTNVDLKNETCGTPQTVSQDTRLLRSDPSCGVNPTVMIPLTKKEAQTEFTDPIDSASSTDTHKVSYNLRPSRFSSYSTLFMFESMLFEDIYGYTTQESCRTLRKNGSRKRKASEPRISEIQCKECVVRLERIDLEGNNIKLNKSCALQVDSRELVTSSVFSNVPLAKCSGTYKCYCCKKVFSTKNKLSKHMETFHTIYISSICSARYMSMDRLVNHYLRQHIPFPRRECCVCFKNFDSLTTLRRHMVLHFKKKIRSINAEANCIAFKKRHKCKDCRKRFWLHSCLEQHEKVCRRENTILNKEHLDSVKIATSSASGRSENSETEEVQTFDAKSYSLALLENEGQSSETESSDISARSTIRSPTGATKRKGSGVASATGNQIDALNRTRKYPCFVCGEKFKTPQNLCEHEDLYFGLANENCYICNTAFPSKDLLQLHMLSSHSINGSAHYTCFCRFCNQGFHNMNKFWIHVHHIHPAHTTFAMKIRSRNSPMCNICKLVFESHSRLIDHKMYYYKEQTFECTVCRESFQGLYQLRHHIQLEHYLATQRDLCIHKCNVCKESFNYESHLHAHKLHAHSDATNVTVTQDHTYMVQTNRFVTTPEDITRVPVKTYGCNVCDLYFINEKDLRMHQMEYSNGGDFFCNKCNRRYYTLALLAKHYCLNHTESDQNVMKCDRCNEVLLTNMSKQCHEKHFHGRNIGLLTGNSMLNMNFFKELNSSELQKDDGNVCTTCATKFDDTVSLKNHLLEYADIGSYSCSHCQRKFTKLCFLEKHKMKHSTSDNSLITDYCPICNEGFTDSANVRIHVLHLHRYETFGLNQNSLPVPHLYEAAEKRTQNNIAPSSDSSDEKNEYKCPECKMEFNINQAMTYRSRFKNSGHLKCSVCGYIFSRFPSHKCNYCTVRFHSAAALYWHVINNHSDDVDASKEFQDSMTFYYLCKVCDIRYTTAKEFLAHDLRMHRKSRKQLWPSAVTTLLALQINMDVCCDKCGKMFQNKKCFKNHFKAFHATDKESERPPEKNVKKIKIGWQNYEPDSTDPSQVVSNVGKVRVKKFAKMLN
ncbi:zinc finger protein 624 isoform X2 [Ceratina calcarata]|nr:zinc finger protein 624 isoform X2 [Ceratina calcarata]